MKHCDDVSIFSLLKQEYVQSSNEERNSLRNVAKHNILKIQAENQHYYIISVIKRPEFIKRYLVVIRRTQFAPGLKIKRKYLGSYHELEIMIDMT